MDKDRDDSHAMTKEMNGNCIAFAAIPVPLILQTIIDRLKKERNRKPHSYRCLFFFSFISSSSFDNSFQSIILFVEKKNNHNARPLCHPIHQKQRPLQQHNEEILNGITIENQPKKKRQRNKNVKKSKQQHVCIVRVRGWYRID